MAHYTFTKVFSTDPGGDLALDLGYRQADQDTAFVRATNRLYRWFAASTEPPSGDVLVSPANADPASAGRWILQGPPSTVFDPALHSQVVPPGFNAACCFTLSSYEDLINVAPPSGNSITLPAGCYIVTDDITLPDDQTIFISSNVRMEGRNGATITGNASPAIIQVNVAATFVARDLNLVNNSTAGSVPAFLTVGGVTFLRRCNFQGAGSDSGAGMRVVDGVIYAWKCEFTGDTGAAQIGGELRADQCLFEASVQNAWFSDESDFYASKCVFRSLAADSAIDASGIARFFFTECEIECVPDGSGVFIVLIDGGAQATIRGGKVTGNVAANDIGIRCACTTTGYPIIDGVQFSQLETAIWNLAGGIPEAAILRSNSSDSTVAEGVNWTTVRIPANGLVELGNQFETATPYVGHAETDARVNRKANTETGALSAETPIV